MNLEPLIEELISLLKQSGVRVRREPIEESRGGLCTVAGEQVLFIDANADPLQAARLCARTLCRVVDIQALYVRPSVRDFIEASTCGDADGPAPTTA
jgi:hypothetical protein